MCTALRPVLILYLICIHFFLNIDHAAPHPLSCRRTNYLSCHILTISFAHTCHTPPKSLQSYVYYSSNTYAHYFYRYVTELYAQLFPRKNPCFHCNSIETKLKIWVSISHRMYHVFLVAKKNFESSQLTFSSPTTLLRTRNDHVELHAVLFAFGVLHKKIPTFFVPFLLHNNARTEIESVQRKGKSIPEAIVEGIHGT